MPKLSNAELEAKVNQLQEKLYASGVEKRPSIMSEIEDIEKDAVEKLYPIYEKYNKDCEKVEETYKKKLDLLTSDYNKQKEKIEKDCEIQTGRPLKNWWDLSKKFVAYKESLIKEKKQVFASDFIPYISGSCS